MNKIALLAAATILAAAGVLATSPPSHGQDVPDHPAIAYPLVNADGTVAHVVHVEAARLTWRSRQAARRWDALIPGLEVRIAPCVATAPCIRAAAGSWAPAEAERVSAGVSRYWIGLTVFQTATDRLLLLNRAALPLSRANAEAYRFRVAMHEMGHALGLDHHSEPGGLMAPSGGRVWEWEPLDSEVAALADYFARVA